MRLHFCVAILACVLASTAHAQLNIPDQQYRCARVDTACLASGKPSASELGFSTANHHPYSINYVEIKDNGDYWDPHELNDALDQLNLALIGAKQRTAIVFVYAHGWQNNASEQCGDVPKFRAFISGLADEYPAAPDGAAPPIVGIYLAWHGWMSNVEPFKHVLTYWPGRSRARFVGRSRMFDVVQVIQKRVNADKEVRRNTMLIFAGHSFGARVMENAIDGLQIGTKHPGFLRKHFDNADSAVKLARSQHHSISEAQSRSFSELPADLIIYGNAATSSELTRRRLHQIKFICTNHPELSFCKADPLYVAFSAVPTADWATGIVMPIANLVIPDLFADHFHLISAADTPWLHTDDNPIQGCPQTQPQSECFNVVQGENPPVQYHLQRIDSRIEVPADKTDPFWIFNVDSNISSDHSDVWNQNVQNMITSIIHSHGRFRELHQKAQAAATVTKASF